MPFIENTIYTSVKGALAFTTEDILQDQCDCSLESPDAPDRLVSLLKKSYTKEEIENKNTTFQVLLHFWSYDEKGQKFIQNTYTNSDNPTKQNLIRDKLTVQVCVLQSLLDEINGLDATVDGIDCNSLPHLEGQERLEALRRLESKEDNPLVKYKIQLEINIQEMDIKAPLFEAFKATYERTYKAAFFKNPWSTMKGKLERQEFTTFDQVLDYAEKHPKTRSAKIIADLKKTLDAQEKIASSTAVRVF